MSNRARVWFLDTADPERSIDDPALAELAAKGWTLSSIVPIERGGQVKAMLILWPPARPVVGSSGSELAILSSPDTFQRVAALLLVALVTGLLGYALGVAL